MENKKGLSMIVSTLIVILLVLVAVGIIWIVARNLLQAGSDQIALSSKCLDISVRATAVICSGSITEDCTVTLTRTASGEELPGVLLSFTNGSQNYLYEYFSTFTALQTKTTPEITTGIVNITEVEITPFFKDESNNTLLCNARSTFTR